MSVSQELEPHTLSLGSALSYGMSYETITVRMNRSDTNIPWGYTLRQQGNRIIVATVDRDSLSDKAGMKAGDEVDAVCGRNAVNMSVNEANSILDSSFQEVNFNLRRYVTSHTCLPWTLTEQDNKLVVDEMQPGYGQGFGGSLSFDRGSSARTKSSLQSSQQHQRSHYQSNQQNINSVQSPFRSFPLISNTVLANQASPCVMVFYGSNRAPHYGSYVATNSQPRMYHSPSTYSRHQQSNFNTAQSSNSYGNGPSYSTAIDGPEPFIRGRSHTYSHVNPTYNTNFGSQRHHSPQNGPRQSEAAQNYSFNNGFTTTAYKPSSGGVPLNQATYIQTSHSPSLHPGGLSPGGTKLLYHSPSPRTRNELSPYASVQHLQYNSPMNIYSVEAAAEEYTQQTGRPTQLPNYRNKTPAYLTSETKKLIEEQERGRGYRLASPSAQSSSFKRISQAVGAPVL
ncbi:unnamed protein product [Cylicocyclus nassatus]|uniref:PDZ domain-containing protein n=1 Tax=Cylicocyclus nassatus TaxID=53992 RepID=A0AA36ME01_CYLNA|nr:unnamed protein product [Cylicocyclus nassatus]